MALVDSGECYREPETPFPSRRANTEELELGAMAAMGPSSVDCSVIALCVTALPVAVAELAALAVAALASRARYGRGDDTGAGTI